jgi:hypothetical protein
MRQVTDVRVLRSLVALLVTPGAGESATPGESPATQGPERLAAADLLACTELDARDMAGLFLQRKRVDEALAAAEWRAVRHLALLELAMILPPQRDVILVDDGQYACSAIGERRVIPFLERNGVYWGPAADDNEAIAEFNRLRTVTTAHCIVFTRAAFWWLRQFPAFRQHLHDTARVLLENGRLIAFSFHEGASRQ